MRLLLQERVQHLCCLLAAFFPLVFTTLWLFSNSQFPTSDATDYILTGHKIYHHFTDHGFWSGLTHFDIARGWRPIFFSVFTVPFLWISQGSAEFAWQAVVLCCILSSAIYVYLLSKLMLDSFLSVLVANIIVLLPFVQTPVLTFFAEAALFPLAMGAIYHLIQSDYFRNKNHAMGFMICMSLAIVVRPVEALTECIFIFMLFLVTGYRKKIFSFRQVLWVMSASAAALFLFTFYVAMHFIHHYPFHPVDGGIYDIKLAKSIYACMCGSLVFLVLMLGGMGCCSVLPRNDGSPLNNLLSSPITIFSGILILTLLWFLPHAFQAYVWIYRTSMGDLAIITANEMSKPSILNLIQYFIREESLMVMSGALLVAILVMILNRKTLFRRMFYQPVIYLLLLLPFPLWEVMFTAQTAIRKLNLAFPALILVLLVVGLQRGKWLRLRIMLVSMMLLVQFGFALSMLNPAIALQSCARLFGYYPHPVQGNPDPYREVISFLNSQAKQYHLNDIVIMNNVETALPVDPHTLTMMAQIYSLPYKMGIPAYSHYSESIIQTFQQEHHAIFLSDKKSEMVISEAAALAYKVKFEKELNPALKVLYQLLYDYSSSALQKQGFQMGPCVVVTGFDHQDYQGCLLITRN